MPENPLDGFVNPWGNGGNLRSNLEQNAAGATQNYINDNNPVNQNALKSGLFENDEVVLGIVDGTTTGKNKEIEIVLKATLVFAVSEKLDPIYKSLLGSAILAWQNHINEYFKSILYKGLRKNGYRITSVISCKTSEEFDTSYKFVENIADQILLEKIYHNDNPNIERPNKKLIVINRGLKIIQIIDPRPPNATGETLDQTYLRPSTAIKNGMFAYINYRHVAVYLNEKEPNIQAKFNKILLHEIGHLFGLEDRYQYLTHYKIDGNGCITIQEHDNEFIPIHIDPNIDSEAEPQSLTNLMYNETGKDLTTYQCKIICGIDKLEEDDYEKLKFIVPENDKVVSTIPLPRNDLKKGKLFLANVELGKIFHWESNDGGETFFKNFDPFYTESSPGNKSPYSIDKIGVVSESPDKTNDLGNIILNTAECNGQKTNNSQKLIIKDPI